MSAKREGTNWGSSLQGECGKSMRLQLWHSGLGGPVLVFWESSMLMIKEDSFPFGSDLGSPSLEFHSQLSNLGWTCLRIDSHKPICHVSL